MLFHLNNRVPNLNRTAGIMYVAIREGATAWRVGILVSIQRADLSSYCSLHPDGLRSKTHMIWSLR